MKRGDRALLYHSNEERSAVGISEIIREAYPDIDLEGGDWSQVDLRYIKRFKRPVSLKEMKEHPKLKDLLLIKQSRLSAMPVSALHYELLCQLGGIS